MNNAATQPSASVGQTNDFEAMAGFNAEKAFLGQPVGWHGANVTLVSGETLSGVYVLGYLIGGVVITRTQLQDNTNIASITNRIFIPYTNLRQVAETR